MKKSFFLITICILTIACGNSEKSKSGKSGSIFKSDKESPCEILSEKEIKDALSIPADAATTMNEKSTTFPICLYKWETITFPGTIGIGKTTKAIDFPAEMNIVLVKDVSKEKYEQSVSFYDDGENQDGVGEMATYSVKKRQITFLSNGYLIHVHVRTSEDEAANRANAIKLAKLIDGKL